MRSLGLAYHIQSKATPLPCLYVHVACLLSYCSLLSTSSDRLRIPIQVSSVTSIVTNLTPQDLHTRFLLTKSNPWVGSLYLRLSIILVAESQVTHLISFLSCIWAKGHASMAGFTNPANNLYCFKNTTLYRLICLASGAESFLTHCSSPLALLLWLGIK